ncbi:MAG TPA: FliA/WhiG family RNA polymerase sigma factor [bacterium]|nr:FliA/WhiG family RNA polymerase sigma factor [bacterium]
MDKKRSAVYKKSSAGDIGTRKGIKAYGRMSSNQIRDELVKKNLRLVSFIVSRMAIGLPSWIDKRDLISTGVIGLIDAAKNFDPQKGVKFETYASTRIRGSIIDELRSLDWIPRTTREKSKEVEGVIALLVGRLGRFPTDGEIATELGWDMDYYNKILDQISGTTLLSLDEIIATTANGDTIKRIDTLKGKSDDPLGNVERKELTDNVAKVIANLSEQERLVVALYYYEELTLKEIGMVLKVSESRVSQIHTATILKIRVKIRSMYSGS